MEESKNIWIVNNPYHLNDIELYNSKYRGDNFFISIIHRPINFNEHKDVLQIKRHDGFFRFFVNWFTVKYKIRRLRIKSHDRIFIFNGQELMNNVVLSIIYKKYSKNIIVVDDSSSCYQFYLEATENSTKVSHVIKLWLFKTLLGVSFNLVYVCKLYYLSLHEKFIKKILFPYKLAYNGPIEIESFERKYQTVNNTDNTTTIFLSQPFYLSDPGYLSYEDYVKLLNATLERLKKRYSIIYFKSHPNDYNYLESQIYNEDKKIVFLIKDVLFEDILHNYPSSTLYSFNSNALMYSFGSGKTTIWLYEIISEQCKFDFSYLNHIVPYNGGKIIHDIEEI